MDAHSFKTARAALSTAVDYYQPDVVTAIRLDLERKSMEAEDLRARVYTTDRDGNTTTWQQLYRNYVIVHESFVQPLILSYDTLRLTCRRVYWYLIAARDVSAMRALTEEPALIGMLDSHDPRDDL